MADVSSSSAFFCGPFAATPSHARAFCSVVSTLAFFAATASQSVFALSAAALALPISVSSAGAAATWVATSG